MKIWTTKYSLFTVWLFAEEYGYFAQKYLGMRFKHLLFKYDNGLVTSYRMRSEADRFAKYLGQRALKHKSYSMRALDELYAAQKGLRFYFDNFKKIMSAKGLRDFITCHEAFSCYYLVPYWAPNFISLTSANTKQKAQLLRKFTQARKKTERLYLDLEEYLEKVYRAIGRKEGYKSSSLQALLPAELIAYVRNKKLPNKKVLAARLKQSVIYTSNGRTELFVGRKASKKSGLVRVPTKASQLLHGAIVYGGKARGRVRVIFKTSRLRGLKKGDILVTAMTRPEWAAAIKRAAGLVTDAGGILSHAAIVARELKKPCIIGTKIATRVLKDGDMVEVDANKGTVQKL